MSQDNTEITKEPTESPAQAETQDSAAVKEKEAPNPQLTKQQRAKKNREQNRAALDLLVETYPEVFSLEKPKPLKIGIHNDIAEDGKISKTKIRRALSLYVRHHKYLHCLTLEDAIRINLKGEEGDKVTAEESEHAQEKYQEQRQNYQKFKKTQQDRKVAKEKEVKVKAKEDRINAKLEALVKKH